MADIRANLAQAWESRKLACQALHDFPRSMRNKRNKRYQAALRNDSKTGAEFDAVLRQAIQAGIAAKVELGWCWL